MKTRRGFVSNSSSSSFIICGDKLIDFPEKYNSKLHAEGWGVSEGCDFFKVTEDMYEFLKENKEIRKSLACFLVDFQKEAEGYQKISTNELPKDSFVFAKEISYHITGSTEDLINRY